MNGSASDVSGTHSAPMEASGPHATAVETASAETAATTAPGKSVFRNQASAYDDQRGQCSQ
jgi:hypothetical protein